jgi:hypothetical protein
MYLFAANMEKNISYLKVAKDWGQNILEQKLINKNIVQQVVFKYCVSS